MQVLIEQLVRPLLGASFVQCCSCHGSSSRLKRRSAAAVLAVDRPIGQLRDVEPLPLQLLRRPASPPLVPMTCHVSCG